LVLTAAIAAEPAIRWVDQHLGTMRLLLRAATAECLFTTDVLSAGASLLAAICTAAFEARVAGFAGTTAADAVDTDLAQSALHTAGTAALGVGVEVGATLVLGTATPAWHTDVLQAGALPDDAALAGVSLVVRAGFVTGTAVLWARLRGALAEGIVTTARPAKVADAEPVDTARTTCRAALLTASAVLRIIEGDTA
jgi:hypothetical protein